MEITGVATFLERSFGFMWIFDVGNFDMNQNGRKKMSDGKFGPNLDN